MSFCSLDTMGNREMDFFVGGQIIFIMGIQSKNNGIDHFPGFPSTADLPVVE